MPQLEEKITRTWFDKTLIGIILVVFTSGLITWAAGLSATTAQSKTDIVRLETTAAQLADRNTSEHIKIEAALARVEKMLDRLAARQ